MKISRTQVTEVKKVYSPASELIPAITESVKKARFSTVKIKDKLDSFSGRVVYEIGTP